MKFSPTNVVLTGTLLSNCVRNDRLSVEVWDWLEENCSDRFCVSRGYNGTPNWSYAHTIRFDYAEHASLFILRWS
jgi:hypothetical protein